MSCGNGRIVSLLESTLEEVKGKLEDALKDVAHDRVLTYEETIKACIEDIGHAMYRQTEIESAIRYAEKNA